MVANKQVTLLDRTGLLIVGLGASLFYFYFENTMKSSNLSISITVLIILLISACTQLLVNSINSAKAALQTANETLEQKVKERTQELRNSELKYRTIFENTGAATIIVEKDKRISLANTRFLDMSGFESSEIEHRKSWPDFVREKYSAEQIRDALPLERRIFALDGGQLECQFVDKFGNHKDILVTFASIPETETRVASLTDVSQLKQAERQIYFQAFHDTLTKLPNRALFIEHLTMAIKRARRHPEKRFAVIYLDIDRFKLVNDSLGHSVGDSLLVAFAERIREDLRETDILARLGGDEFAILLEDLDETSGYASQIAERLQKSLKKPFTISGKEVFAPASFGVVLNTGGYELPDAIVRDADAAMYHAKESGRAQVKLFDQSLHEKALQLLQQETDLRKAVDKSQFQNHYQPIVRLDTGAVTGLEALVRWTHPELGIIAPGQFIPTAEDTGLIFPITRLTVAQACNDLKAWRENVGRRMELTVSVNISSKHFMQPSLLDEIRVILDATGLPPHLLKLEITESALLDQAEENVRLAHRLRDFGFRLALDDFGTGYSSLSYLQRLPIDTLKIDRSFIAKIHEKPESNHNIVEAIVSLAHKLGITVVAEGIETPEQHAILLKMGCELGQGYLFSPPLAKPQIDALLNQLAAKPNHPTEFPCPHVGCLSN